MPTIRQEINILTHKLTGSTVDSSEIVQLDTAQYVNPTYYFEVVAQNVLGGETIALRRKGTTTDDVTITPSTVSSYTRFRSSSFTPPAGQTEYIIHAVQVGSGVDVKSAKIIIIDNPTTLTSSETQIEIGMIKTGLTSTAATKVVPDSTLTKYWKYTAANWDGTTTFYAEVTYLMASSKSGGTFVLQEDNGSFASWTDKVTIVSAGVATAATRVRSASFTPTDGRNYRIAYFVASSKSAASIFNAKVIVDQIYTDIDSYSEANSSNARQDYSGLSNGQSFTGNGSAIVAAIVQLKKGGSPAGNMFAKIYAHSGVYGTSSVPTGAALATSDAFDVSTLTTSFIMQPFIFSGANQITPTNGTNYVLTLETSGGDASNAAQWGSDTNSPTASGNRSFNTGSGWTAAATEDMIFHIVSAFPALLEPQYLLLNTADSNATGVQGYQTLWDSTEWSGVTNTYKHAIDSDNASNSAKLRDITGSADVTSSTVTGANQQISSALTMPTTGDEIDTWILNTTGVVGASRILVQSTVSSSTSASITQVAATITASGGTQSVSAISTSSVSITQVAATVTATGGIQTAKSNASLAQSAANVTASGGTQTAVGTVLNLSFKQSTTGGSTTGSPAVSSAFGSPVTAGNLIVVTTADNSGTTTGVTAVSDTGGNTYSQILDTHGTNGFQMWYAVITTGGSSFTVSVTWSTGFTSQVQFVAQEFQGFTGTPALDKSAFSPSTGGTTSQNPTSGATATTTHPQEIVVGGVQHSGTASAFSLGSGYTNLGTVNATGVAVAQESMGVATTGAQTATFSIAASSEWVAGVATFYDNTSSASANITQLAATVIATGGVPSVAAQISANVSQSGGTISAAGGIQTITTVRIVSIAQSAGVITASGGTQSITTTQFVSITQLAGTVTATGGTQVAKTNAAISQSAASVTAAGGTQSIATVQNVSITQLAATITAAGGAQSVGNVQSVTIAQTAANITATGGTQTAASVQKVATSQLAATITATGGTQTINAVRNVAISHVAATVTAAGGTQSVVAKQLVNIAQIAANITASGGTQALSIVLSAAISQLAATITAFGGTQTVSAADFSLPFDDLTIVSYTDYLIITSYEDTIRLTSRADDSLTIKSFTDSLIIKQNADDLTDKSTSDDLTVHSYEDNLIISS